MKRRHGLLLAAELVVLVAGMSACTFWRSLDGIPAPPAPTAESSRLDYVYGACGSVIDETKPPQAFPVDGGLLGEDTIYVFQRKDGRTAWLYVEDFGGVGVLDHVLCDKPVLGPNGVYDGPPPP